MGWGITGWSSNSRTPLNYRLRAGQFRSSFAPTFSNKNYISIKQYNYGCGSFEDYNYGCCGNDYCDNGGMTKLEKILFGLGAFGTILGGFLGGGNKTEKTEKEETEIPESEVETTTENTTNNSTSNVTNNSTVNTPNNSVTSPTNNSTSSQNAPKVAAKEEFGKLFNKAYVDNNYDKDKGLKVGNKYYENVDDAFKAYSNNSAVKYSSIGNLNEILSKLKGVYDDGAAGIGDFENARADMSTFKGNEVKIGSHTYTITQEDNGYTYFKDKDTAASNPQKYLLEVDANGNFSLHQRTDIMHNDGIDKAAH